MITGWGFLCLGLNTSHRRLCPWCLPSLDESRLVPEKHSGLCQDPGYEPSGAWALVPNWPFTCVNLDASLSISKASSLPSAVGRILPQGRQDWMRRHLMRKARHPQSRHMGFLCGYYCFDLGCLSLKIQGFLYDSWACLSFHKWWFDSMFGDLKMIFSKRN